MTHTYTQTGTRTYGQTYGQTVARSAGQSQELHVLDDRDILTDLLLCGKQLLSAYGTAAIESTNAQLRSTLQQIAQSEADFHKKTFEMMQQRGWYETPRSDAQLAGQIASLWTEKLQRGGRQSQGGHTQGYGGTPRHGYGAQGGTYGAQGGTYGGPSQGSGWQPQSGDSPPWQPGWSGQTGDQGQQPWNQSRPHGQAASKTWDPEGGSSAGPIPGAHT